jgi:nucleoside-triphosphatase
VNDWCTLTAVSGSVGAGKTTFCHRVIHTIKDSPRSSWRIQGILSPAVFDGEKKIAIDALDLASGERRRLAQRRTPSSSGILTRQWSIDETTIDWCNEVLRKSVPCDLLIVDEIGPLEFKREQGFTEGLFALDSRQYQAAFVVIRKELLSAAEERWPGVNTVEIHDREQAVVSAAEFVEKITP